VAVLFLLGGTSNVIDVVLALREGRIDPNVGILGIPIFFGLRAFSPQWRTAALVFLWIGFLLCPFIVFSVAFSDVPVEFQLFGRHIAAFPSYRMSIAGILLFLLLVWQYRVLVRPDIRALFVTDSSHREDGPQAEAAPLNGER
jgi:hypothetical protein